MHIFIKTVALLFAITHLWVSGSLLLHQHEDCHEVEGSSCQHTDAAQAHDDCAICYYIYLPHAIAPCIPLQLEYTPSVFYATYSIVIHPDIVILKPRSNPNRGPPLLERQYS